MPPKVKATRKASSKASPKKITSKKTIITKSSTTTCKKKAVDKSIKKQKGGEGIINFAFTTHYESMIWNKYAELCPPGLFSRCTEKKLADKFYDLNLIKATNFDKERTGKNVSKEILVLILLFLYSKIILKYYFKFQNKNISNVNIDISKLKLDESDSYKKMKNTIKKYAIYRPLSTISINNLDDAFLNKVKVEEKGQIYYNIDIDFLQKLSDSIDNNTNIPINTSKEFYITIYNTFKELKKNVYNILNPLPPYEGGDGSLFSFGETKRNIFSGNKYNKNNCIWKAFTKLCSIGFFSSYCKASTLAGYFKDLNRIEVPNFNTKNKLNIYLKKDFTGVDGVDVVFVSKQILILVILYIYSKFILVINKKEDAKMEFRFLDPAFYTDMKTSIRKYASDKGLNSINVEFLQKSLDDDAYLNNVLLKDPDYKYELNIKLLKKIFEKCISQNASNNSQLNKSNIFYKTIYDNLMKIKNPNIQNGGLGFGKRKMTLFGVGNKYYNSHIYILFKELCPAMTLFDKCKSSTLRKNTLVELRETTFLLNNRNNGSTIIPTKFDIPFHSCLLILLYIYSFCILKFYYGENSFTIEFKNLDEKFFSDMKDKIREYSKISELKKIAIPHKIFNEIYNLNKIRLIYFDFEKLSNICSDSETTTKNINNYINTTSNKTNTYINSYNCIGEQGFEELIYKPLKQNIKNLKKQVNDIKNIKQNTSKITSSNI